MKYRAIAKGHGYVYVHANQLYKCVCTVGLTKYLKCINLKLDVELTDFAVLCATNFITKCVKFYPMLN